jgi:hypothetical protein
MHSNFSTAAFGVLLRVTSALPAAAGPSRAKVDDAVRSGIRSGARTQKIIITVNPGCRAAIVDWGTASSGESDNVVWGTGGGL